MSKHTPGPWQYYFYNGGNGTRFPIESLNEHGKPHHGIACVAPNETASTMLTMEQHRANARLIAAAPELLEACAEVVRVLDALGWKNVASDWPVVTDACELARTAIAKATGEAP